MLSQNKVFNVRKELLDLKHWVKKCRLDLINPDINKEVLNNFSVIHQNYSKKISSDPNFSENNMLYVMFIKIQKNIIKIKLKPLFRLKFHTKKFQVNNQNLEFIKHIHSEILTTLYKFFTLFNGTLSEEMPMDVLENFVVMCLPENHRDQFKGISNMAKQTSKITPELLNNPEKFKEVMNDILKNNSSDQHTSEHKEINLEDK